MEEIWKDVVGYEGLYQVRNMGQVKSYDKAWNCGKQGNTLYVKKSRILRPQLKRAGYFSVNLYSNTGKMSTKTIHRLVLSAFIPNIHNKPQVNHIDFNRTNNVLSNLEWSTVVENSKHSYKNYICHSLRQLKAINDSGLHKKAVVQYDVKGNKIKEYDSVSQASMEMCGRVSANINNHIAKSKRAGKTAYGFIWKYKTT